MAKKSKTSPTFSGGPAPVESSIASVVNPDAPSTDTTRTAAATPSADSTSTADDAPRAVDPRERIAARAYERYLQRGGEHGRATEDWLEAEREISSASESGSGSSGER